MKLIIHDLEEQFFNNLFTNDDDTVIISNDSSIKNCIGCFGCWIKTPGACVIKDKYCNIGELYSKCTELIIVSKCFYGSFCPFVKKVLDRGISYMLPDFEIRNKEMHHKRRYENIISYTVYFYGDNITAEDRDTALKLVNGNVINLDGKLNSVKFVENIKDIGGVL